LLVAIPEFCSIDDSFFAEVFDSKVRFCSHISVFVEGGERPIAAKTTNLTELKYALVHPTPTREMTEARLTQLYDMVEANVLRPLCPFDLRLFQEEAMPPMIEPAWVHLQIIYEILLDLHLTQPQWLRHLEFVPKLLEIADSPDPNERMFISTFLAQVIQTNPPYRDSLMQLFLSAWERRLDEPERGVFLLTTLLPVFQFVFCDGWMLEEEAYRIFQQDIVPLMSHPLLWHFASSLDEVIELFVSIFPRAIPVVVMFLILIWPVSSSA
jgi:serine/threonine-protein phosphatase 2A regulatory subunit B'